MKHFRGRPNATASAWLALCGVEPAPDAITTRVHEATCPECRRVLGLAPRREAEPHWQEERERET